MADAESEVAEQDVATLDPAEENLDYMRRASEEDFFFFARNVLGYDNSVMEWEEPPEDPELRHDKKNWKRIQVDRKGPEYGISQLGPHKEMAELLLSGSPKKHLEAPRGSYKTTLTLCWLIWYLLFKNRNARVLYLMDTLNEAKKKVLAIRNHFEKNLLLRQLWPGVEVESRGDKGSFTLSGRTKVIVDPSFEAGGVDSDMTGSHRDIIVMDDAVNFLNVRTKEGIDKTRAYFSMAEPLLDPGGIFLVIGTRYDDADLYGDILRDMSTNVGGDWDTLVLDCGMELMQDAQKFWTLVGVPIFAHLTRQVLLSKLWSMDRVRFASQYLNRCLAAGQQVFYRYQFRTARWDASWMTNLRYHILTDTATTTADHGCFSVVALVGMDAIDNAFLVDLRVGKWPPNRIPHEICDIWEQWTGRGCRVAQVLMENTTLNKTFRAMLENEMRTRQFRCHIEDVPRGTTDGSKDQRILGLAMRFEQQRFFVCDTVSTWYNDGHSNKLLFDAGGYAGRDGTKLPAGELVDEFIRFPVGKYKDIPDALADLDATRKDGRRICTGSGKKEELRDILSRRAGQAASPASPRRGMPRSREIGAKWDALAERAGGRRHG